MQGFNMGRYHPPEPPSPPRRTKQKPAGPPKVRFAAPYSIVCTSCSKSIGRGTRFNAIKSQTGDYLSVPIWSFEIKHADCGGILTIQTDPENADYVVLEGGYRQYPRAPDDAALLSGGGEDGDDAFALLEADKIEREQLRQANLRVAELYEAQSVWEDAYTANQRLRRRFRAERKVHEAVAADGRRLQDKFGLELDIGPETAEDEARAGSAFRRGQRGARFGIRRGRADPFLEPGEKTKVALKGVLKKRPAESAEPEEPQKRTKESTFTSTSASTSAALVGYSSESDGTDGG